ncbi:isoprenylcysteine carboxylmethyltransferase family protein [Aromatoleum toluvorans]|uniref:Isoprenylcysteine carboxylmethyltransferase family protein n=1 Tax=Aromatoleum toluvorans TaxID=92002 RepID=A0ABX1PX26_9RHOO|nr:isoprenylcysteine carboxylmethyltransferase family protein [Aromatoleum toluvorans]NMG43061.1 isoprenylcysteine carboxylmethyltransferase family protein [Aromatoleum toluvorans]
MKPLEKTAASAHLHRASGVILSILWALFAIAHFNGFHLTGRTSLLMFGLAETAIGVFFLLRTQPKSCTTRPHEWVTALAGTFLPLFLRPTTDTPIAIADWCLVLGSTVQIVGVLSLNRSFALVPALRELKTHGMYRFVRHPIYFSYLINYTSYLTANFSAENLLIILGSIGFLVARVFFEERHLSQTPEYRAYQDRVRWRLLPYVF